MKKIIESVIRLLLPRYAGPEFRRWQPDATRLPTPVLAKSIFSAPKPAAQVIAPPAPMPTVDDAAVQAAKKKKAVEIATRSGRDSTILTDSTGDTLG